MAKKLNKKVRQNLIRVVAQAAASQQADQRMINYIWATTGLSRNQAKQHFYKLEKQWGRR